MEDYKKEFAKTLARTGALFFGDGLILKDGRSTPYFVNFASFNTGRMSGELGSFFARMMISSGLVKDVDIVLGPSYKGSSIALAATIALWRDHGEDMLFEYDRKEAKTHGESSGTKSLFVNNTFFDGCRIFIVDDVATSMGTKYDLLEKIEGEAQARNMTIEVAGIGIGIDRQQTMAVYDEDGEVVHGARGEDAIDTFVRTTGVKVYSVAGIREVVAYLHGEGFPVMVKGTRQSLDDATMTEFEAYVERYGVQ